jgi:hypothetical protein
VRDNFPYHNSNALPDEARSQTAAASKGNELGLKDGETFTCR